MKTATTIQVLKSTIGNPATRAILKGMSGKMHAFRVNSQKK